MAFARCCGNVLSKCNPQSRVEDYINKYLNVIYGTLVSYKYNVRMSDLPSAVSSSVKTEVSRWLICTKRKWTLDIRWRCLLFQQLLVREQGSRHENGLAGTNECHNGCTKYPLASGTHILPEFTYEFTNNYEGEMELDFCVVWHGPRQRVWSQSLADW